MDFEQFGLGHTAFVTGGSRGIGHATSVTLAKHGFDIAFTYQSNEESAAETVAEIENLGRRCYCYQATMQEAETPTRVTRQAIVDLGRLDALVTVAGITRLYPLVSLTPEKIDNVYNCNFRAPLLCTAAAVEHMIANGIHGGIVHIASTHAFRAYPEDQVYGGLKAAITRSTESEALELSQYGIRVNCVAPGMISVRGPDTMEHLQREWGSKVPLGRWGKADEVADTVAFLLSEKAAYITGITIKVDGGLILPGMPEDSSPEAGYGWRKSH
jgi:NAD(P)-dependent dehydrogenase (short-subunit alcohol dehydrogenase family)